MAPLTVENSLLIKTLRIEKGWAVDRIIAESPARVVRAYFVLLVRRIDYGRVEKLPDSGRHRSVRTQSNIKLVNDLIVSQEGQPGTIKSPRKITRETGMSHSSIVICRSVFRRREVQSLAACRQTETIECMQMFEETHASEQAKLYIVLG